MTECQYFRAQFRTRTVSVLLLHTTGISCTHVPDRRVNPEAFLSAKKLIINPPAALLAAMFAIHQFAFPSGKEGLGTISLPLLVAKVDNELPAAKLAKHEFASTSGKVGQ